MLIKVRERETSQPPITYPNLHKSRLLFLHRKHHENARRTEEDVREVVLDDAEARRFDLEGLIPFTRYSVSVQVINPEGVGPTATCTVSTDEGGGGRSVTIPLPALQLIFFALALIF